MTEETFVGFWPTREEVGVVEPFTLDKGGYPDKGTRDRCIATHLDFSGPGWKIKLCGDYLLLVHLESLEPALETERKQDARDVTYSMAGTSAAWPKYVEALNALNFLLFASCNTGRGHSILHDFLELNFWQCARIKYDASGNPLTHANYGRFTGAYLRRYGERTYKKPLTLSKITDETFKDMAYYWSIFFDANLVSLAALGAKVISDHRLGNYRAAIVLAWFEIESWIIETAAGLGIKTTRTVKKTGEVKTLYITDILKKLPAGTTVKVNHKDIDDLRKIRNKIAHKNYQPSLIDSALAIRTLMYVMNLNTGLWLKVDTNAPPRIGLS